MSERFCYFFKFLINRFKEQRCPSHITLRNDLPEDKKKYFNGSISLCHCRGHDCIIVVTYFYGFYEADRRLYSNAVYWIDN